MPTLAVIGGAGRRQRSLELENSMKIEAFHREGVKNMPIDPKLGIDEYITGLLIARQFTGSGRVCHTAGFASARRRLRCLGLCILFTASRIIYVSVGLTVTCKTSTAGLAFDRFGHVFILRNLFSKETGLECLKY